MKAEPGRCIRGKRTKGRPVVITGRDVEIVTLAAVCGYVSSEQLSREFFPSEDRCRRRLRQLFDAGLVDVHILSSTKPALICVTREGLAVLREYAPEVAAQARPRSAIKVAGVSHHLGIVDARLYVAALAAAEGQVVVAWSNAGGHLHEALGLREAHGLVPDAIFEVGSVGTGNVTASTTGTDHNGGTGNVTVTTISNGEVTTRVALEVDCGTEAVAGSGEDSVVSKFAKYAEVFTRDDNDVPALDELWVVLSVDVGPGREEHLRRRVLAAGLGEVTRIFTHGHVRQRPVAPPPPCVGGRGTVRTGGPPQAVSAAAALPPRDRTVGHQHPVGDRRADRIPGGRGGR